MDHRESHDREQIRQAHVFASGALLLSGDGKLQAVVDAAAKAFGTPMAALSIIDRDRQFLPVSFGLDVSETSRAVSFCSRAIERPGEILCVPDATEDARFATNPLVTGPPAIRFYAGFALESAPGTALGALCVIDSQPRPPLTDEERVLLTELAALCQQEIARARSLLTSSVEAVEMIAVQIQHALETGNEPLVTELDRILQDMEANIKRVRTLTRDFPQRT